MLKWMRDRDSPGMQLAVNNMENVLRGKKKMYFSLLSKKFKLFWILKTYAVKMCGSSGLKDIRYCHKLTCALQTSPGGHPAHPVGVEENLSAPYTETLMTLFCSSPFISVTCLGAVHWHQSCRAFLSSLL